MIRTVVVLLLGAGLFLGWRSVPEPATADRASAHRGTLDRDNSYRDKSANTTPFETRSSTVAEAGAGAFVDTAESVVRWRGTKFGGRGAHAGVVRLKSGTLDYNARRADLRGARFDLDMRSIAITDMPLAETSARHKLLTHLLAADFFDVANHPTARFDVRRVTSRGGNLVRLDGDLTLRGVTRAFGMDATVWSYEPTRLHATARATLDRMQWGVAFRGSRLTNDLVDDLIHLEFDIVARVSNSEAAR